MVGVRDGPSMKMQVALTESLVLPVQAVLFHLVLVLLLGWACRAGEMVSRRKVCHDSVEPIFKTSFSAARRRRSSCMKMFSFEYIIKHNNRYFKT